VVPSAAFEALLGDSAVTDRATALARETENRWVDAARDGLSDASLREDAEALLRLAAENSAEHSDMLHAAADRCRRGDPPAADTAHGYATDSRSPSTYKESV